MLMLFCCSTLYWKTTAYKTKLCDNYDSVMYTAVCVYVCFILNSCKHLGIPLSHNLCSVRGMYVCMYVCMYVACMYVCIMHVCMYVCMCMYVYMYVCMHVCIYVVCMYHVCMYVCMCVCMYVCMYAHPLVHPSICPLTHPSIQSSIPLLEYAYLYIPIYQSHCFGSWWHNRYWCTSNIKIQNDTCHLQST